MMAADGKSFRVDPRWADDSALEFQRGEARAWTVAWVAAAWAIFLTDLVAARINVGMIYVLVLALLLVASHRTSIWRPALFMSACVLAGYFLKPFGPIDSFVDRLSHPRMLNRSMIVLVLLATAALAPRLQAGLDPSLWRRPRESEGGIGEEGMFLNLARSAAGITSVLLLIGALIVDIATPISVNGTILLPIALLWAVQAGNRRLMLWLIPMTVIVPLVALVIGQLSSSHPIETYMLSNRLIAVLATSALALALYRTVTREESDRAPTPRVQPPAGLADSAKDRRTLN
jgi:hypothetical protein